MEILLATGNENKAKEVQSVLGRPVQHIKIDLPEVQAVDVKDIIEDKAREAYQQMGKPVLVEDTSLSFKAWNGLPGALIHWFLKTVGNAGICKMLGGYEDLEATAQTCIGYFDGRDFFSFSGTTDGKVVKAPRGDKGFGWDPIFQPNGWDKTFAEMTPEEKHSVSMRKLAVLQLKEFLDGQNL